jgi:hypothetical protein
MLDKAKAQKQHCWCITHRSFLAQVRVQLRLCRTHLFFVREHALELQVAVQHSINEPRLVAALSCSARHIVPLHLPACFKQHSS